MANAQEWLNKEYSKEERSKIVELDISFKGLEGKVNYPPLIEVGASNNSK